MISSRFCKPLIATDRKKMLLRREISCCPPPHGGDSVVELVRSGSCLFGAGRDSVELRLTLCFPCLTQSVTLLHLLFCAPCTHENTLKVSVFRENSSCTPKTCGAVAHVPCVQSSQHH